VAFWTRFRRDRDGIEEATRALTPGQLPERTGFAYGIPRGGLNEYQSGIGEATQTDRKSTLQQLYESYLACPWSWASVNAIARTITAGGLVMDWDTDTGEGSQEAPEKPENVLAAERLFAFTNDRQNIRQLLRNVIVDLLVFGDAYIEITWWGDAPVALYNLDNPTTTPTADEHGKVTGYVQVTDQGQRAEFEPRDVIHISLDAPRSGVFGVSPTQAALLPITAWLFAAATVKEMFRKGLPPTVHADFPAGASKGEQNTWVAQVMAQNIGPRNIGRPWVTKGGGKLTELQAGKVADALAFLSQKRDEILASYGVPPAKAGVIESGNLGGGTGEEQDRTYRVDVCGPIGELILEALNFSVIQGGFGVKGWHAKFREVDYRASQVIEAIRDMRLRNGSWTLDKYRAEIGEPPADGGDLPVLVDRQNLVLWSDMAAMSKAMVASKSGPAFAAGEQMQTGPVPGQPGAAPQDGEDDGKPAESVSPLMLARYRRRLREAQIAMGLTETTDPGGAVYAQLSKDFPPGAISWVRSASWQGPQRVPVSQVDTRDRDQWDASRDQAKVAKLRRKLRRKLAKGEDPKPLVLVRWPGSDKDVIADGHHHFLAAEAEGQQFIWAYVGHVDSEKGPWLEMAAREDRGRAA
jgi:Phage portal protein